MMNDLVRFRVRVKVNVNLEPTCLCRRSFALVWKESKREPLLCKVSLKEVVFHVGQQLLEMRESHELNLRLDHALLVSYGLADVFGTQNAFSIFLTTRSKTTCHARRGYCWARRCPKRRAPGTWLEDAHLAAGLTQRLSDTDTEH